MRHLILLLGIVPFLISCGSSKQSVYKEQIYTFGTIVEFNVWGVDEKIARQATAEVAQDFDYMHKAWNPWKPGSLARMNQLFATQLEFTGAPSILPLIVDAQKLSLQSHGLFNPAIGKIIKLWGFSQEQPPKGPPPDAKLIADLVQQHPSMSDIHVNGISVKSDNPAVLLDFGAFAKGYAVDKAIEHFRSLGINNAIVNAGGDLRAIGRRGDRNWRIGIRDPRGPGILASVETHGDESVFTSGDYERFYEYEGKRYHHIIDPRTGYPAYGVTSVTVIHNIAATADAAATALFVAGPKDWYAIAKSMGVKMAMVVDSNGVVYMNPAMAKRIHFEKSTPPKIILSDPLS